MIDTFKPTITTISSIASSSRYVHPHLTKYGHDPVPEEVFLGGPRPSSLFPHQSFLFKPNVIPGHLPSAGHRLRLV